MSNWVKRFRQVDTSSISDAMDSLGISGCLLGVCNQVPGTFCAGPAFTIRYGAYESEVTGFKNASNYIDDVPAGAVVMIDNQGKADCTVWGDILSAYAAQRRIAATVIFGAARDISAIKAMGYPLFSSHIYMRSGKNRVTKQEIGGKVVVSGVEIHPGDWIIGDENGCVAIPARYVDEVLNRAERIEKTESKIRFAISEGMDLKEARALFGYHAPWKEHQLERAGDENPV